MHAPEYRPPEPVSRSSPPCVSVCLPVYNGETYLAEAIESVLAQSFENFELILADNASKDRTSSICHDFQARDGRVRYLPADVNRGLAWNYNRSFGAATGRYVLWLGHDDKMAPDLLRRCVGALEQDASTVIAFARTQYIDEAGVLSGQVGPERTGDASSASERLLQILFDDMCHPVLGLMRRATLARTRLHLPYADSDRVLLVEMGLRGRFELIDEPFMARRLHYNQTTVIYDDRWERTLIFDPSQQGRILCPWLREVKDLLSAVRMSSVRGRERLACYKRVYWWVNAHRRFVVEDAWRGLRHVAARIAGTPAPKAVTPSTPSVANS